jgi:hypothetical protein
MSDQHPIGFYARYLQALAARPRDPDADAERERIDDRYWRTKRGLDAQRDQPRVVQCTSGGER